MYSTMKPLSARLVSAKMAITNALADDYVREALKELGFDEAKLQLGLEIYKRAENFYQVQKREYSEQYSATEAFYSAWEEARTVTRKYVTAAKLVLMDAPSLRNSLGLNEGYPFTISDFLTQARLFYTTALQSAEVLDQLKEFAVTEEKLQAGLQLVEKVEALNSKQEIEKSEAQQATRERDAAFAELDRFMYQLNKVARLLLTEKPEYLEKLGILERSAPTRKKDQDLQGEQDVRDESEESSDAA